MLAIENILLIFRKYEDTTIDMQDSAAGYPPLHDITKSGFFFFNKK